MTQREQRPVRVSDDLALDLKESREECEKVKSELADLVIGYEHKRLVEAERKRAVDYNAASVEWMRQMDDFVRLVEQTIAGGPLQTFRGDVKLIVDAAIEVKP